MATSRAEAIANGTISYSLGNKDIEGSLAKAANQNQQYLEEAQKLYEPYKQTGLSSLNEYTKLLTGGVDALNDDQNFQALTKQAENAVMANRATSGLLRSGATAGALDDTLLNFANTYYNNRLNQLQQGANYGTNAINAESSILEKMGGNATDLATALANIQMQREGNTATINAAKAQAGATTSAAQTKANAAMTSGIIGTVGSIIGGLL